MTDTKMLSEKEAEELIIKALQNIVEHLEQGRKVLLQEAHIINNKIVLAKKNELTPQDKEQMRAKVNKYRGKSEGFSDAIAIITTAAEIIVAPNENSNSDIILPEGFIR